MAFRPGGTGAAIRAARRDSCAWRVGDRHLRVPRAPRRRGRLPRRSVGLCWRRNEAALLCPCSEDALTGAVDAARAGLIDPVLVGPKEQIAEVAAKAKLDVSSYQFGAVAGLMAIVYNRLLLGTIDTIGRLDRWPVELHAGLIGAAVGMLAWLAPDLVGGGDAITQRALFGVDTLAVLPLVFLLRLGLGAISYAAGTPGGLFPHARTGRPIGIVLRAALPARISGSEHPA